jgi:mRNA interferase MazF
VVNQGEIYWVDLGSPRGSGPGYRRPYLVIQNNTYNHGMINTTIVCGLTTNLNRALVPGNLLLNEGEAGLPKRSVVVVTQLYTVDKRDLVERIGAISTNRVRQILQGLSEVLTP